MSSTKQETTCQFSESSFYVNSDQATETQTSFSGETMQSQQFKTAFYNPFEIKRRKRTTRTQFKTLEKHFIENPKPNASMRRWLAQQLDMTPRGVQVWFQNRRAKEKVQKKPDTWDGQEHQTKSEQRVRQCSYPSLLDEDELLMTPNTSPLLDLAWDTFQWPIDTSKLIPSYWSSELYEPRLFDPLLDPFFNPYDLLDRRHTL
ncbi:Homeodomain-like protein [Sporodiniella umbellata]|nr:Homeodomain-like protein [Sporodiniella umbellata]